MDDHIRDRAVELLRRSQRIALPLDEIEACLAASATPVDRTVLERTLGQDPRLHLLHDAAPLPGLDAWSAADLAAYRVAFVSAGLTPTPVVILSNDDGSSESAVPAASEIVDSGCHDGLPALLKATIVDLLDSTSAPRLAAAAERALAALNAAPTD